MRQMPSERIILPMACFNCGLVSYRRFHLPLAEIDGGVIVTQACWRCGSPSRRDFTSIKELFEGSILYQPIEVTPRKMDA